MLKYSRKIHGDELWTKNDKLEYLGAVIDINTKEVNEITGRILD